jgi:hypothetical protein
MEIDSIIALLQEIKDNESKRNSNIVSFDKLMLHRDLLSIDDEIYNILNEFYVELQLFVTNPEYRKEDPSFYGPDELKLKISHTIEKLRPLQNKI